MDMIDSIANLSVSMSQQTLMTNISTAVLDMTLDSFEGQASEMVKPPSASPSHWPDPQRNPASYPKRRY